MEFLKLGTDALKLSVQEGPALALSVAKARCGRVWVWVRETVSPRNATGQHCSWHCMGPKHHVIYDP